MSAPTQLDRIEALMRQLIAQTAPKMPHVDGKIFKDMPAKYWGGESYAGNKFSECPPDYLRAFAKYKGACVWAAEKKYSETKDEAEIKYVQGNKDAATAALQWAEYQEASGGEVHTPAPKKVAPPVSSEVDDDTTPF